jgi:PncC family amidohydrolase
MYKEIAAKAKTIVDLANAAGITIGAAESCTGGWIGQSVTAIPGSSNMFMGSLVTYSNEAKMKVLGIPSDIINYYGAVSEPTANAMAMQARDILDVDIAVSVTGIAGPGGGSEDKPVGTVYFGLAAGGKPKIFKKNFENMDREQVRIKSVLFAFELIEQRLRD